MLKNKEKIEILSIHQFKFEKEFLEVLNQKVSQENLFSVLIESREKYLKNCAIDEFYDDSVHDNKILKKYCKFKESYPDKYEKMEYPLFETVVMVKKDDVEMIFTMLNMKIANEEEILNIIKNFKGD